MSKLERSVIEALRAAGLKAETGEKRRMPVKSCPWTARKAPLCDVVLGDKIFVEVKGIMTIYAMAKLAWLSQQKFAYYVFQASDEDWDPWSDSPLGNAMPPQNLSREERKKRNWDRQVAELLLLTGSPNALAECTRLTRPRLRRYIQVRTTEFTKWTGSWP